MRKIWRHGLDPIIRIQAFITSLTVGTVLVGINLSSRLLGQGLTAYLGFKAFLTYLVPYCVATYTALSMQPRVEPGQQVIEEGIYRCEKCLESGEIHEEQLGENDVVPSCQRHGDNTEFVLRTSGLK